MNEGLTTCGRPSRGRYVQGCRCYMCRVANADYSRENDAMRRAHRRRMDDDAMVGVASVQKCRRHVLDLLAHGWTKRGICAASGVGKSALSSLLDGHPRNPGRQIRRMKRENYKALMALDVERPRIAGGQVVDAKPVNDAIAWLTGHGMTRYRIAAESGIPLGSIYTIGRSGRCTQATAAKLARAARRLRRECERADRYARER